MILSEPSVVRYYDQSSRAGSDKRYPSLDLVRLEANFFQERKGRLLDYACGTGANLIHMLECGYEADAVDTSANSIEVVANKLKARGLADRARLQVLPEDLTGIPFEDDTFDFITCVSLLSLLATHERIDALLAELRRVLKPGGKIIVDINGPESCFARFAQPLGGDRFLYHGHNGKAGPIPCVCPATIEDFVAMVSPHFKVVETGFTAHRFFNNCEQEFIICAEKG